VHGILRTADATSPVIGESILTTLILFVIAYGVVFSFGIYYINRLIVHGPDSPTDDQQTPTPVNPISAAQAG